MAGFFGLLELNFNQQIKFHLQLNIFIHFPEDFSKNIHRVADIFY